jgi:hypothetical protein
LAEAGNIRRTPSDRVFLLIVFPYLQIIDNLIASIQLVHGSLHRNYALVDLQFSDADH